MHYIDNNKLSPEDFRKIDYISFLFSDEALDEILGLKSCFSDFNLNIHFDEFRKIVEGEDKIYYVTVNNQKRSFYAAGLVIPSDISGHSIFVGNISDKYNTKPFIVDLTQSALPDYLKENETTINLAILCKEKAELATEKEYVALIQSILKKCKERVCQ